MSTQSRRVTGYNVMELSHLAPTFAHEAGRRCHYCGSPVNRYQQHDMCCRCEDAGMEPPPTAERLAPVEDAAVATFRPSMNTTELRETLQLHFGSMATAAKYLGIASGQLYNYTSKRSRARYQQVPQKYIDKLNAWVRGEVK